MTTGYTVYFLYMWRSFSQRSGPFHLLIYLPFVYVSIAIMEPLLSALVSFKTLLVEIRCAKVCLVLPQVFQLCFMGLSHTSLWLWLFLTLSPPDLPLLSPSPTANYCFDARDESCSVCLQSGKDCAYCFEEVRAGVLDSNLSIQR